MKTTSKNKENGIDADVSGNRLPFKSQSINNFCGIDISQPTPSESLSVPLFSLVHGHGSTGSHQAIQFEGASNLITTIKL